MKVLESAFGRDFVRLADHGWQLRFHERNGGNLSYRIPAEAVEEVREDLHFDGAWHDIGCNVPDLGGEFFMVTGTGKFFSDVKERPAYTAGVIELDGEGRRYRVVWGLDDGGLPTSELPAHLLNHEVKKKVTDGRYRVIYHCHPANLIAMTFVLPLDDKTVTRELWESMTECMVIFPKGVGVIPWMVPGGREIAEATAEKMKRYDVAIWAHHGVFCASDTFDNAFGLAHAVEKSAEIFGKIRAMVPEKRQTITHQNFVDLARDYHVPADLTLLD